MPRAEVVARLLAAYEREGLVEVAEEAHHAFEANDDAEGGTHQSETNTKATESAAADDEEDAKPPKTSSASDTNMPAA